LYSFAVAIGFQGWKLKASIATRAGCGERVSGCKRGLVPGLAVILIGEGPASAAMLAVPTTSQASSVALILMQLDATGRVFQARTRDLA